MPRWPALSLEERFRSKFTLGAPDECWVWRGTILKSGGYGLIMDGRKPIRAHRLAFEFHHGVKLASGRRDVICHHCDNPPCVNPKHLFRGTRADNSADMVRKGRAKGPPEGTMNQNAKMTEQRVHEMRRLHTEGIGTRRLSRKFSIDRQTAWAIVHYKTWKHI